MKKLLLSSFVFVVLLSLICVSAIAASQGSTEQTLSTLTSETIASGTYYLSNGDYKMYMKHDEKKKHEAISVSKETLPESSFVIKEDVDGHYLIFPLETENEYVVHAWWEYNIFGEENRLQGPTLNGDEVALWNNDKDMSQRWLFEKCGDGYLIHPGDATYLSITRAENNRLYVMTTTGNANQIWKLEPNSSCEHTYKYTLINDAKHLAECTVCGAKENKLHSTDMQIYYDSDNHWLYCVDCDVYFSFQEHNYSNDCDKNCKTCDYTRNTSHAYDNACDESCNNCGETRSITHSYYEYKYDVTQDVKSTKHWQECSVCGNKINEQSHSFSPIMSSFDRPLYNNNGHYMGCDICSWWESQEHEYENNCDSTCSICPYERTASEHLYDNNCDTDCNVCGDTRSITHIYVNECDPDCNICGALREASDHIYDNSCDANCNICGYVRNITHTYDNECDPECNICGDTRSITHTYDNECDPECNICGALREVPDHIYDNGCDPDCNICGCIRDAGHIYDEGVITKEPTVIARGEITYTCTRCGEKKCDPLWFTLDIEGMLSEKINISGMDIEIKKVVIISLCAIVVLSVLISLIRKKR